MQYTSEKPVKELTLKLFYSSESTSQRLYEDGGEGYEYQDGKFSIRTFEIQPKKNSYQIKQSQKGEFQTSYDSILIEGYGFSDKIQKCQVDGKKASFSISAGKLKLKVAAGFKTIVLE